MRQSCALERRGRDELGIDARFMGEADAPLTSAPARRSTRSAPHATRSSGPRCGSTAMRAIARMRDMSVSDATPGSKQYEKDHAEYNDFLRVTGAGDHPSYLKQLHRFARYLDEPKLPPPNPKPVPGNGQRPSNSLYKPTAPRQ